MAYGPGTFKGVLLTVTDADEIPKFSLREYLSDQYQDTCNEHALTHIDSSDKYDVVARFEVPDTRLPDLQCV